MNDSHKTKVMLFVFFTTLKKKLNEKKLKEKRTMTQKKEMYICVCLSVQSVAKSVSNANRK